MKTIINKKGSMDPIKLVATVVFILLFVYVIGNMSLNQIKGGFDQLKFVCGEPMPGGSYLTQCQKDSCDATEGWEVLFKPGDAAHAAGCPIERYYCCKKLNPDFLD